MPHHRQRIEAARTAWKKNIDEGETISSEEDECQGGGEDGSQGGGEGGSQGGGEGGGEGGSQGGGEGGGEGGSSVKPSSVSAALSGRQLCETLAITLYQGSGGGSSVKPKSAAVLGGSGKVRPPCACTPRAHPRPNPDPIPGPDPDPDPDPGRRRGWQPGRQPRPGQQGRQLCQAQVGRRAGRRWQGPPTLCMHPARTPSP